MHIIHSHVWGSQERWDLVYTKMNLICSENEEGQALNLGWLLYNDNWYQGRSVRIASNNICPSFPYYSISLENNLDNLDEINAVWNEYKEERNFHNNWSLETDLDRTKWLIFRDGCGHIAGFTKMLVYNGGIESQFNAYLNYYKNISFNMLKYETYVAHQHGYDHLYIGTGFEKKSIYKSKFNGFEFWNGNNWSANKADYTKLCHQDSSVLVLADLEKIANK